jgi:hypothetical protein
MIRSQRFDGIQPAEAGGATRSLSREVMIHTKIDHPKEFASYVHTYKDVAPGYLSDTRTVLHL